MKNILNNLPKRMIPVGAAFVVCAVLLFLSAILIEVKLIFMDSSDVLIITALVISAFAGSFMTVVSFGTKGDGFVFAILFFGMLTMMAFLKRGNECFDAMTVKQVISIFSGTISGNLLGSRRHYKLRNSGKKSLRATK